MSEQNPFLAKEGVQGGGDSAAAGRGVDAGRSIEWLKQGWRLFTNNPGVWIAITVILLVIFIILSFIPVIGQLAANFLMPVFAAGVLGGCRSLHDGGELRIDHLFAGFKQNTGSLILLGVFYLVGMVAIMAVIFVIGGGAAFSGAMMGRGPGVGMAIGGFFLAMLVGVALMVPLAMAMFFATPLVAFKGAAPLDAMKASFAACLRNILPLIVYGVIVFVASIVAMIPFGLGLLVLVPVLIGSMYTSYVEIFEQA